MSTQTVPIQFVERTIRTAQHRGIGVDELLRGIGIAPSLIANPLTRVTAEQATKVTQRLWQLTDDEMFGVGRLPVPRGTFRLMSMALIHSPDLRTVVLRCDEFTTILPGTPRLQVTVGKIARVEIDTSDLDDPEHMVTDLLMAVVHRFLGWLIGKRIKLLSIELPYPRPPDAADYGRIFGRVPAFDADRAALSFDGALLPAPILRTEQELIEYINHSPADLLARRDYGSATADQVRRMLERGLGGDWPTSEDVANRLMISLQHLRRLLREEGTSVTAIKEDILRDAAIAGLVLGEESVEELSARLGFSETSAFRRAFRRWTGSAPGTYRRGGSAAELEPGVAPGDLDE